MPSKAPDQNVSGKDRAGGRGQVRTLIIIRLAWLGALDSSYEVPAFPACNHVVYTYAGAKGRPIAGKKAIPNPPQKILVSIH